MEAVRIIKEMREQSGGVYPTFAIWENVPGAFSSNRGEDFRAVLEELARVKETGVSIPRPAADKKGRIKWAKAGFICGDGWSLAWRTFDAQFWGVPQRRKRIALVVDFGEERAGEILFERTGVSGHLEPSVPPWKGIARNPACCASGHDRVVEKQTAGGNQVTACLYSAYGIKWNGNGGAYSGDNFVMEPKSYNLKIRSGCEGGGKGPLVQTEKSATLSTLQDQTLFCLVNNQGEQSIQLEDRTAYHSTQANEPVIYTASFEPGILGREGGHFYSELSGTLRANAGDNQMSVLCCVGFTAGQGAKANGIGWAEEHAPTLRTDGGLSAMLTVLHRMRAFGDYVQDDVASSVKARDFKDATDLIAECIDCRNHRSNGDMSGTLQAKESGGFSLNYINSVAYKKLRWIVHRLTPLECERLQGFPDGWTDIGEWVDSKGKRHKPSDGPRYKALGNSIALPQWWWLACKMAQYLPEHATLGSLFDGIGGFPLVWETLHGKGTAVWASEIEEFPIAVTKRRFEE